MSAESEASAGRLSALSGRRVFVTGHTGFKGSWTLLALDRLSAEAYGYSQPAPTRPSLYEAAGLADLVRTSEVGDVRDAARVREAVRRTAPDVVLHFAAQPLVRAAYRDPVETFDVNVMGTVAVLDAVRACGRPCAVVVVTSDKCYQNTGQPWGYRESDRLGGSDPYSASKGAAELAVAAYRDAYFPPDRLDRHGVQVATVRAGNVIGGGDWAADRLVTDLVRCLAEGVPVPIRRPDAIRPWQHVLEPVFGYLTLAAEMLRRPSPDWCGPWNFGPEPLDAVDVRRFVSRFVTAWGEGKWRVTEADGGAEAGILRLAIDKSAAGLGWRPAWSVGEAVARTAGWYKAFLREPGAARALCVRDLTDYLDDRARLGDAEA